MTLHTFIFTLPLPPFFPPRSFSPSKLRLCDLYRTSGGFLTPTLRTRLFHIRPRNTQQCKECVTSQCVANAERTPGEVVAATLLSLRARYVMSHVLEQRVMGHGWWCVTLTAPLQLWRVLDRFHPLCDAPVTSAHRGTGASSSLEVPALRTGSKAMPAAASWNVAPRWRMCGAKGVAVRVPCRNDLCRLVTRRCRRPQPRPALPPTKIRPPRHHHAHLLPACRAHRQCPALWSRPPRHTASTKLV